MFERMAAMRASHLMQQSVSMRQHCRKDKHFISAPINLQISAIRPANQCNSTGKKYKCFMCGALLAISGNDTCSPFVYFKTVSNVLFHSSY
jgi:hypothetical protein